MLTSSCDDLASRLRRMLRDCSYPGYVYGYPHKKAYRDLAHPLTLREAWAGEEKRHLFCYVHVPFCGQRCSFCNLFTYVPAGASPAGAYLDAMERELEAYALALGDFRFTRLYIGGGTPTWLDESELERLLRMLRATLRVDPPATHGCIEASPETVSPQKIALLREAGFHRLSLGVQSLVAEELRQVNRRFDFDLHAPAIRWVGDARFPHFNIDLIYGLPGQTEESWKYSLDRATDSPATSLFLYPLYVRPLTGLAVKRRASLDSPAPTPRLMAALYDLALDRLTRAGFRQLTMRQFRRDPPNENTDDEYVCQRDGMVGLGAGARSYTTGLHYSTPWKMVSKNIRGVVEDYQRRLTAGDSSVYHGFALDQDERRRRFVIQSLLFDGLDTAAFEELFRLDVRRHFAEAWDALLEEKCVTEGEVIRLTPRGVRHADVVGQLFFSPRVTRLVEAYEYDS
jgi:oxygen-independent coproporphyrinogen-3 oxidase